MWCPRHLGKEVVEEMRATDVVSTVVLMGYWGSRLEKGWWEADHRGHRVKVRTSMEGRAGGTSGREDW